MRIIGFGPFIGDFEQEVTTFRPYIKWISEVVENEAIYLNTHFNRAFLYDWIPTENIFPVYEHLSRDELGQLGYVHNQFTVKDHNLLTKIFKEKIVNIQKCSKRDIEIFNLNYARSTQAYTIFKKRFSPISVPDINIKEEYLNKVIYILAPGYHLEAVYEYLHSEYDAIVIGDLKLTGYCSDKNEMLKTIDYFENGFKYILKILQSAKAIVCPVGFWTFLANLQGYPVFSFGDAPGNYKENGVYYFDNKKSLVIPTNEGTDLPSIFKMIDYFMEKL